MAPPSETSVSLSLDLSIPKPQDQYSFKDHTCNKDDFRSECEKKVKAFKKILMSKEGSEGDSFEILTMIDAIQRLGIEHNFAEEINAILRNNYMKYSSYYNNTNNLHEVALRFRLLRQDGYFVPADVFNKFKDEEGNFKVELSEELVGLMSLYEASHLSIAGEEETLDKGKDYCYQILNSRVNHLHDPQAKLIENVLKHPHYKSLPKFMAKEFNDNIEEQNWWINELQEIAKLDFKMAQSQHQQEILQILEWWKELGLSKELKFARNQPIKWYVWCMTALTDPILSDQRIDLIKPIALVYLIDDIFDVHGELQDLILFTQIVNRWDIGAAQQLPEYMRSCFKALNDITNEISDKVSKQSGWNPLATLQKSWGSLCNAFLVEAKWFASGKMPSTEEYLKNGIVSSGVGVVLLQLFFLLGQDLSQQNIEFIDTNPTIITSTAKILRLWDDLGSAKDENQDGHDGSYIEYYMKEQKETSIKNATNYVLEMIEDTWKQLNEECLFQNPFSKTFTKACLNVARMVPLMYSYDENSRLPILEDRINSLLNDNNNVS